MDSGVLQSPITDRAEDGKFAGGGGEAAGPALANQAHPLYGLSVTDRIESRQRVMAEALAEILRSKAVSLH